MSTLKLIATAALVLANNHVADNRNRQAAIDAEVQHSERVEQLLRRKDEIFKMLDKRHWAKDFPSKRGFLNVNFEMACDKIEEYRLTRAIYAYHWAVTYLSRV